MLQETDRRTLRGELALIAAVLINSFGVVLMLYSGAGISAISSVPFAFSEVITKKFVPQYLFSFVVGFAFGEFLDVHELWIGILPQTIPCRILYFILSYFLICFGIALSNRCGLPIIPTDLFPRELSDIIRVGYPKIKIAFDVICLTVTACMTGFLLGHLDGLGIGTILAAFTMGKCIGLIGSWMDKRYTFVTVLTKE